MKSQMFKAKEIKLKEFWLKTNGTSHNLSYEDLSQIRDKRIFEETIRRVK